MIASFWIVEKKVEEVHNCQSSHIHAHSQQNIDQSVFGEFFDGFDEWKRELYEYND
jgi:hypothetical protein